MDVLPARRGACPRVWAPMESGDGLIVRVHPPSRGVSAHTLRALAELAREHGNGQLELTRRANLQLRGVTAASLPALQTALVRLGLVPASAAEELRRVLLVSPLSGLDPACASLEALAAQLEHTLAGLPPHTQLPAKFGVLLDSGASILHELAADIVVDVRPEQPDIAHLSVGESAARLALGACPSSALDQALRQLIALLDRETRMRDLVATRGVQWVRAQLEGLIVAAEPPASRRVAPLIGFQRGVRDWFGVSMPFGSGEPREWLAVAQLAEDFGEGELRLTASRALLLPGVRAQQAERLGQLARGHGLIVDPSDPLLRATACAGAPACAAALGETRALARQLAREVMPRLGQDTTLHVSGCSKSCASRSPARITIVRDTDGDKLGFDLDAVQTARGRAIPGPSALARLTEMAAARR
jgi:precorrin-3B synthase